MQRFFSSFLALFLTFASLPAFSQTFWTDLPSDQLSVILSEKMSDEELLAQILMFGWAGSEPSELLNDWVAQRGLGSVKVFGWNTDDIKLVAKSVSSLQKKAMSRPLQIPLFVATDQEGGWIRHVKGKTSDTPGNMAIGASGYPADAYYSGYYINKEIKAVGININFAPTIDLYTNLKSTVIGPRSFGSDTNFVGTLGAAFSQGCLDAGVIPTAKHFPGHGDTALDSHGKLPEINIDYNTLMNRELIPFKYLIKQNIPAIMSGHLSFPNIVSNGEPASLSYTFLTKILREQLGYKGLIITDDMMMNGATMYAGSLSKAFRLAIEAGNDIIISSTTAKLGEALWTTNLSLMKTDAAFREKVKTAARRVLYYKLNYFKSSNAAPLYPDPETLDQYIPDKNAKVFFYNQACRSITPLKADCVPFHPAEGERVLYCGFSQFPEFWKEAEKRFGKAERFSFNHDMGPNECQWVIDNIGKTISGYDTVILCVENERSLKIAESIRRFKNQGKKIIIFSLLSPMHAMNLTWADAVLFGYSYSPYTFQALFAALAGDFKMQGELPLK